MDYLRRFFVELRRRKVFRVAVVYAAVSFVTLQVAGLVVVPLQLPPWTMALLIVLISLGFPLALVLAWAFEITPEGVRRTEPEGGAPVEGSGRWARQWGVLALVIVGAGVAWLGLRSLAGPPEAAVPEGGEGSAPATVAVLPFADMSPEGDHEYFADGMTEELIHLLTAVEGLRSVPRTSVFAFKGHGGDVREVGRELGAEFVLEGSVRRFQDRIRITVALVDVTGGVALASESWERQVEDIFQLQDEVARLIVGALRDQLPGGTVGEAPAVEEGDFEAYDLYLRGRFLWHRRTEASLREAREMFEQVVTINSRFPRGWVGLADAYAVLGFYGYLPPREAFPRARGAAERALELAPGEAAAHATLAYVALYYDWDLPRAESGFRRALELDPGYSTAHQWYGNLLTAQGGFAEALASMRTALELDPLSLIAGAAQGWVLYYAGDFLGALAHLRTVLELDSSFELAHLWMGQSLKELGRLDEAEGHLARAEELSGGSALTRAARARLLALEGRADEARRILAELQEEASDSYLSSYELARVHATLGDRDEAFRRLEEARGDRARSMVFLRFEPAFAPLRDDPRFMALVEEVFGRR